MSENERDTHFAGFAKVLFDELLSVDAGRIDISSYNQMDDAMIDRYRLIITQRSYDLVKHAIEEDSDVPQWMLTNRKKHVADVPDVTAWPEQKAGEPPGGR